MTILGRLKSLGTAVLSAFRPGNAQTAAPAATSFEDFGRDLEASFGDEVDMAMLGANRDLPPAGLPTGDDGGPAELFASIAATYCQPIKEFIVELKQGTATHEWIEMCMPVMGSIIHGAESLDLHQVAARMVEFRDALTAVESMDKSKPFDRAARELILKRYEALVEALPQTFEAGDDSDRRDSIIMHSLLRQVPDVGRVTLEKLYAAGLTSMATLYLANPGDMAAATGVPATLCERICRRISEHRQQIEGGSDASSQFDCRRQLVARVSELRQHQEELRRISDSARAASDNGAAKRECIRLRQSCSLQIEILLAEMGEVELVQEVRKLGIDPRIARLNQYLGTDTAGAETPVTSSDTGREE